jgi:RNA polymerase sigma-70 factor (ECF subfamily)
MEAIKTLPEEQREVVFLTFYEGLSYAEIAGTMQRTLAWVKVRMFRARVALMECVRLALRGEVGGL